jgi:hypothetical protein
MMPLPVTPSRPASSSCAIHRPVSLHFRPRFCKLDIDKLFSPDATKPKPRQRKVILLTCTYAEKGDTNRAR